MLNVTIYSIHGSYGFKYSLPSSDELHRINSKSLMFFVHVFKSNSEILQ